jgi:hypothetical protein
VKHLFFAFLFLAGFQSTAQNIIPIKDSSNEYPKKRHDIHIDGLPTRQWLVGGISVAAYGGSLLYLNEAWYKGYERKGFHTFNDSKEWLQMDKIGHAWTAYNTSRASTAAWKWAGLSPNEAVIIGSLSGFSYLTVIEWLDGYSAKWGWSWPDIAANFSGSTLFAAQELIWQEQRIQFKYSAHRKNYPDQLEDRANELFGKSLPERLLKDYNAQTLWLSFNLNSFLPQKGLPPWLNLSFGYGADGMFGGIENKAVDKQGNITFYRPDISRRRQWYLSPDIDFTKIKTSKKGIRLLLVVLNTIKVPAPALEFSGNKIKGRWISF